MKIGTDRFWSKVHVGVDDECWPWTAAINWKGYGRFKTLLRSGVPGHERAHRVAWSLCKGEIPDGSLVLHRCDNPACCNPNHLFLGTTQDNINDKINKNRQLRGEQIAQAKLNSATIIKIRECLCLGVSQSVIATKFAVSQATVSNIKRKTVWNHVS